MGLIDLAFSASIASPIVLLNEYWTIGISVLII